MRFTAKSIAAIGLLAAAVAAGGFYAGTWKRSHASLDRAVVTSPPAPPQAMEGVAPGNGAADSRSSSEPPASVELSEQEQRSIGVETVEVRRRSIAGALMTVGRVEEAETQLAAISARVGGRIDKLFLNFTGESVRRGQTTALIYSPEVASAAEEYRLALESVERLGSQARPEALSQANDLVAASRRRLELWGLTGQQIQEIAKSDHPPIHITISSTVNGTVMERKVTQGQYVKEGDVLYTVADLSTVWVKADVYESDLPRVRTGQSVEIVAEMLPAKLSGRVDFIEPVLNPQTRTVPVRIQVANPGLRLRPGMFVNATFTTTGAQEVLAVPRSAVLDAGTRKLVYVARGNGVFEQRQVEVGAASEEFYPVLSGVKEGERVVTHGSFLIDSQTRLSGGMTGLFGGSKEFSTAAPQAPSGTAGTFKVVLRTVPEQPAGGAEAGFPV
ncbi:MAG: efflux RND transporter periplasmic adaptor subunit, partial [Terriglobales bacterium]